MAENVKFSTVKTAGLVALVFTQTVRFLPVVVLMAVSHFGASMAANCKHFKVTLAGSIVLVLALMVRP